MDIATYALYAFSIEFLILIVGFALRAKVFPGAKYKNHIDLIMVVVSFIALALGISVDVWGYALGILDIIDYFTIAYAVLFIALLAYYLYSRKKEKITYYGLHRSEYEVKEYIDYEIVQSGARITFVSFDGKKVLLDNVEIPEKWGTVEFGLKARQEDIYDCVYLRNVPAKSPKEIAIRFLNYSLFLFDLFIANQVINIFVEGTECYLSLEGLMFLMFCSVAFHLGRLIKGFHGVFVAAIVLCLGFFLLF